MIINNLCGEKLSADQDAVNVFKLEWISYWLTTLKNKFTKQMRLV